MPTKLSCSSPDQVGRWLGGAADRVSEESKWLMEGSPGCGIRAGPVGSAPSSARATEPGAGDPCKAIPASNPRILRVQNSLLSWARFCLHWGPRAGSLGASPESQEAEEMKMSAKLSEEIAALAQMSATVLRQRYAELFGDPTQVGNRAWLVRRIAWRLQAQAEGGLSERARRRAAELANEADLRYNSPPAQINGTPPALSRLPAPGHVLTRLY